MTETRRAGAPEAPLDAFAIGSRFIGLREVPGLASHPDILAMLRLDQSWPEGDHVPWCSAFLNYVAWLAGVPRSRSLLARSWLAVGEPIALEEARSGWDVAVLRAPGRGQPDATVRDAPGHVGFYSSHAGSRIVLLGGNQSDAVSIAGFPLSRLLGVRRLRG